MNSSFLQRLPPPVEARLRRWLPPLAAALLAQLAVLHALPRAEPDLRRTRGTLLANDTPTLLRWSRSARAGSAAAKLQAIPLQGLSALPPPPPSTLPAGALPEPSSPAPSSPQSDAPRAGGAGLPRQPGEAFRLARQVAQAERSPQPSLALVAVQRRQWWLLPGQDQRLQTLWDGGQEQTLPPALGPSPQDAALRSVNAADAGMLGLGELHGRSLVDGDQLWLFWRQGSSLWVLRGPLAPPPSAAS